jgi:hypothetical protein
MNGVNISESSPDERVAEIGAILARALMRLLRGKSSAFPDDFGESSLHISPDQSVPSPPRQRENARD